MRVALVRLEEREEVSRGVLLINEEARFVTLEDGFKESPGSYRVPEGLYKCKRVLSPKFGQTFEIMGVAGHSELRFHWGNTSEQTRGCPLIGQHFFRINGKQAIGRTRTAFKQFMDIMEGVDEFPYQVISVARHLIR